MQQLRKKSSKTVKRALAVVLSLAMVAASLAIYPSNTDAAKKKKVNVKKVAITKPATKTLVLKKGKTYKLGTKVTVTPNKKANKKLTFKSNKSKIVSVNKKGVLKAKKNGKATITVTSALNKKKSAKLNVQVGTPITKVSLNKTKLTLEIEKEETLKVTYKPKKPTIKKVKWKSSDTSIATVTAGKVKGVKDGTAKITATTTDGSGKKATCTVTVVKQTLPTPAPDNRKTHMLEDFESYAVDTKWEKYTGKWSAGSMTVVTDPENPANKLLKVVNNNESGYDFAPVLTKTLPAGKTLKDYEAVKINVRVEGNGYTEYAHKVAAAYFAKEGTITGEHQFSTSAKTTDEYYKEEESKFHVDKNMAAAKPKAVDAEGNASYDESEEINRFFPMPNTTKENDPGFRDESVPADKQVKFKEITLTFRPDYMKDQGVTNKGLDLTTLNTFDMVVGASYPAPPAGATFAWYIDDIRLVEKEGSGGDVAITKLTIAPASIEMLPDQNRKLTITKEPENATETYDVTSSDPSVVEVDGTGTLTSKKAGTATITAKAKNSNVTATCQVTVKEIKPQETIILIPSEDNSVFPDNSSVTNYTGDGGGVKVVYGDANGNGTLDEGENPEHKSVTFKLDSDTAVDLSEYKEIEVDMTMLPPISGTQHKFNVSPIIFGAVDAYGNEGDVRAAVDKGIYQDINFNANNTRIKQAFALQPGAIEKLKEIGFIMVGSNGPNTSEVIIHSIKIIPHNPAS